MRNSDQGASLRDRATRPPAQAPSGLGDTASVPSARELRHGVKSTPGPWFGPNFNNTPAESTRAMTGKFKARGHKTPTDYLLRVEISGENVAADARLIVKSPQMLELLKDCEESFTADDSYKLLRTACRKLIAEIEGQSA